MKNVATTSLRALQACRSQNGGVRALSSSACSLDAWAEAESSKSSSIVEPWKFGTHYTQRPGESKEAAWLRNMKEARQFRRKQAGIKSQVPLYIPSGETMQRKPSSPIEATLSTLMASGAALGHAKELLNPAYMPYVYGTRSGLSIIDLEQTLPMLRRAASLVRDVVKDDGTVLFVGAKQHQNALNKVQERLGDNGYVTHEWIPGSITNAEHIFGRSSVTSGEYLPSLMILLNARENLGAIREATARNVPTIGVVDTDMDPRAVTYAIPANADSIRTAELIAGTLSIAGQEGRRIRLREAARILEIKQQERSFRERRRSAERGREAQEGQEGQE